MSQIDAYMHNSKIRFEESRRERQKEEETYDRLQKEFGMNRGDVLKMRGKLGRKTKTYDATIYDVLKFKEDELARIKKYQEKREQEKLKKQQEDEAIKKRFEERFPEQAKKEREAIEQEKRDKEERQMRVREELQKEELEREKQRLLRVQQETLMKKKNEEEKIATRRRDEYHNQMEEMRQAHRERLESRRQRRIDETKEFINTAKMGAEDVRGQQLRELTLEERRQQAMERSLRVPNPSRAPSPVPAVTDKGYDSGTGSESERDEETRRQTAMRRITVFEPLPVRPPEPPQVVIDRSHLYATQRERGVFGDMRGYGNTGVGFHMNVGSKHPGAKLSESKAQEIRTKFWARPGADIGSGYSSFAKEFGVTGKSIQQVIERATWSGDDELYPLVPGEPEWLLFMPGKSERTVMEKANKEELQVRKGGAIGLTDVPIIARRVAKKKVEKEKKAEE